VDPGRRSARERGRRRGDPQGPRAPAAYGRTPRPPPARVARGPEPRRRPRSRTDRPPQDDAAQGIPRRRIFFSRPR
jgi:hypothetical protein